MRGPILALCWLASLAAPVAAAPEAAPLPAIQQISYGNAPQQFGRLHLPAGPGPHPVLALIHGGCWQKAIADHEYLEPLAAALARQGWAVWSIEYLGTDEPGGGWPNTFLDVANAIDQLRTLAPQHALDLKRLAFAGHSAGGHLALWAASRSQLPRNSRAATGSPLLPQRVIGLAAITDLASYQRDNRDCGAAIPFLRGSARLDEVSPLQMLPPAAAVTLIRADDDAIVPASQALDYGRAATARGVKLSQVRIAGDHFSVAEPLDPGLQALLDALAGR
ncbi:MAG TPA: alpha/beta hydrolase [Solimonas sp.]|nr:alpha/beta hydrolase [Solimonas sp.]